jgi:hypothetical protein
LLLGCRRVGDRGGDALCLVHGVLVCRPARHGAWSASGPPGPHLLGFGRISKMGVFGEKETYEYQRICGGYHC